MEHPGPFFGRPLSSFAARVGFEEEVLFSSDNYFFAFLNYMRPEVVDLNKTVSPIRETETETETETENLNICMPHRSSSKLVLMLHAVIDTCLPL